LARVAPQEIIALARDCGRASDYLGQGMEVRPFDYDAPEQLAASLEGVTRLLFISSDTPETRLAQHRAVIDAAADAGLTFLAYTSILHADVNPISLAETHRATERMIRESGLRHAILRNGWYIENYLIGAEAAAAHGVLIGSTGDGRIAAATRADYAEAAAVVLTGDTSNDRVYELAGDAAFTLSDVAAVLSEAAGQPVAYEDLSEAAYCDALIASGVPADFAAALAEYSAKASGGILADDTRTLSRLIGRPTASMRDVLLAALGNQSALKGASQ